MCVVNVKEFRNNPTKYLRIAQTEKVMIEDEGLTFELVMKKELSINEDEFITGDELLKQVSTHIETMFEDRKQIITEDDLADSYSVDELKAVMKKEIHQIFNH